MPEFIEQENWPPNSPNLNPADYSVWGALQQMVYRHKISDTGQLQQVLIDSLAQVSQNTLNPAIDQLPRRLTIIIKAKGNSSGLTMCARYRLCFTVLRMKIEQNSCVIVKFNAILGY